MPQEDVYKVDLFYHTSQKQMIATHYYGAGPQVPTDPFEEPQALAVAFAAALVPGYRIAVAQGTSLGCIKVEPVTGPKFPTYVEFLSNVGGFRGADPLPANMAVILRRRGVFGGKSRRSLLFLGGVAEDDTDGSFLDSTYVTTALFTLLELYNDLLTNGSEFQLAEWFPVMPHTPRTYARDIPVTADLSANTLTLDDATTWDGRGFITGPGFAIAAPSKNKGSYFATIVPGSSAVSLTENELEVVGPEVIDVQQASGPTSYFAVTSAVANTAVRQLNRRRSSHTGIVA
jgi:hypothetical protein